MLALAASLAWATTAHASTRIVLNARDKGAGSLRNTINNAKDGDRIVFDPSLAGQTITLTSDQLSIQKNLDIEGPDAGLLTISGNETHPMPQDFASAFKVGEDDKHIATVERE